MENDTLGGGLGKQHDNRQANGKHPELPKTHPPSTVAQSWRRRGANDNESFRHGSGTAAANTLQDIRGPPPARCGRNNSPRVETIACAGHPSRRARCSTGAASRPMTAVRRCKQSFGSRTTRTTPATNTHTGTWTIMFFPCGDARPSNVADGLHMSFMWLSS